MVRMNRRICLLGNSIILGSLGISLKICPDYEVITLMRQDAQELMTLNPDVVLFDMESTYSQDALSLLEICPSLMLIGVSPDKNLVRVWSGQQLQELSTQGLLNVINEQTKWLPVSSNDRDTVHRSNNEVNLK
jgi:hypothetical protein